MRMLHGVLLCFAVAAAGCDDPPTAPRDVSQLTIVLASPDTVRMGDTLAVQAELRSASGHIVAGRVDWISRNENILALTGGRVQATGPGFTYLIAQSGDAVDSVGVLVGTSGCRFVDITIKSGNGFAGSLIGAGSNGYPEGSGPNAIHFHGVPALFGSGIIYGHHPDSTFVGFGFHGYPPTDLSGIPCRVTSDPMHTVALVRRGFNTPAHPTNLVVTQDQWAFYVEDENDFVIFRFRFHNRGDRPITGLRVGFSADFDVYRPKTNIGRFDPETGIASAVSADSANEPVTMGMIALGATTVNYFEALSTGPRMTRAEHFELLASSELEPAESVVHDVRQIIAIEPLTLQPGETKSVGYALVGGETKAEFLRNVALARQKAATVWH